MKNQNPHPGSDGRLRQHGFTLVEVLLVAAIMIILAAVAVPGLRQATASYNLSTSTAMLVSRLREAQANAAKRNRPAWVAISSNARTVTVQTTDTGGSTINLATTQMLPGVSFAASSPTQVTFNSFGRPTSVNLTMTLTVSPSGSSKTIVISPQGKISVS